MTEFSASILLVSSKTKLSSLKPQAASCFYCRLGYYILFKQRSPIYGCCLRRPAAMMMIDAIAFAAELDDDARLMQQHAAAQYSRRDIDERQLAFQYHAAYH